MKDRILFFILFSVFCAAPALVSAGEVRQAGKFRYINPLLECETEQSRSRLLHPFRKKLEDFIRQTALKKKAFHVSVYFRDLNNGPWVGINEKEDFSPASMLKVPLMMAYYSMSEKDPGLLDTRILFDKLESYNNVASIRPQSQLVRGQSYTVDDLVRRMIRYSDNDAARILVEHSSKDLLAGVYEDLGINIPGVRTVEDVMPVKDYASFFRILFNASYLNRENSEKALQLLSQSEFKKGLVAGVPPYIVVAHKYGERSYVDEENRSISLRQLHDCGIVYYPQRPYLLCIMTRGGEVGDLSSAIAEISRLVYEEVDRQLSPE